MWKEEGGSKSIANESREEERRWVIIAIEIEMACEGQKMDREFTIIRAKL